MHSSLEHALATPGKYLVSTRYMAARGMATWIEVVEDWSNGKRELVCYQLTDGVHQKRDGVLHIDGWNPLAEVFQPGEVGLLEGAP